MKFTSIALSAGRSRFLRLPVLAVPAVVLSLALALCAAPAAVGPLVYVVTSNGQFGTVDLSTGAFHQIGSPTPEAQANLVRHNGSLFSLTVSGNDAGSLAKIDPSTGEVTVIGPTGLGFNAFDLGQANGMLYVTDFSNNLYSVDPTSGAATLLRATGIPPDPAVPFSFNSDGTINLCDESLYGFAGKLYATFDSFTLNPDTLATGTNIQPALYQIDPSTGIATEIAPTNLNLGATVEVNGKFYAFKWITTGFSEFGPQIQSQLLTLDLATGQTAPVLNPAGPVFVDASAGGIVGAAPASALSGGSANSGKPPSPRWR
jgi:outer membrane protein assembly factor BamB